MLEELVKNLKAAQKAIQEFSDGFEYKIVEFDKIYENCLSENIYTNLHSLKEAHWSIYYDENHYHDVYTNNPNLKLDNVEVFYHPTPSKMEFKMGKPILPVLTLEQYRLELSTGIKHVICGCGKYSLVNTCVECANKIEDELEEGDSAYDRSSLLFNDDLWKK